MKESGKTLRNWGKKYEKKSSVQQKTEND